MTVKIGLIQMECANSWEENINKAYEECSMLSQKGVQIICLPELFHCPYFPVQEQTESFDYAIDLDPLWYLTEFTELSKTYENVIILPIFEKVMNGVYFNTALVLEDGKLIGKYRKTHIPNDPNFYEKFYFTPGDLGLPVFETKFGRIGVLICWDQWFPEPARIMTLKGAEIIFYPTAIGNDAYNITAYDLSTQRGAWMSIQRGHAIANGIFVAIANRVGHEHPINFWGESFVCEPDGNFSQVLGKKESDSLIAYCDLIKVSQARHNWPFLRDRRIDLYHDIVKGYIEK